MATITSVPIADKDLDQQKAAGAWGREAAYRFEISRHPDPHRVTASLGAGDHQRNFDRGPQMRAAKGREQMADADCRAFAAPLLEDFGLIDMAADPEDEDRRQKPDRE